MGNLLENVEKQVGDEASESDRVGKGYFERDLLESFWEERLLVESAERVLREFVP